MVLYLGSQLHLAVDDHVLEQGVVDDVTESHLEAEMVVARHQEFELAFFAIRRLAHQEGLKVEFRSRWRGHRDVFEFR